DVTQLISDNPGGLYRIKLSFRRQHIVFDCPDEPIDTVPEEEIDMNTPYQESETSNWDYYEDGYYDWDEYYSQRENPCHKAYYKEIGSHKIEVSRNVLISDIGLIAKKDHSDTVKIVSTDIKNAEPLSGVTIQILDYQQQVIATGKTDRMGMVKLYSPQEPFLVVAANNNQKGYLRLDKGSSLPISHFDVGGESIQKGIKGYIYGERGVWRPGDTLFLTFILHDPSGQVPAEHPVIFDLYDAKNHHVTTIKTKKSTNGFFCFKVPTKESDPTGNWLAKVKVGGVLFEQQLKVETIMPNRLKIKIDFGKDMLTDNEDISATLSSQWLHGAIARNLKADVELKLQPSFTRFNRYTDFQFDDPARRYEPETFTIFDSNLDENGNAPITFSVHASNESPGALSAKFTTRVFEPGGAFSIDRFSIPFHPYSQYIGIRTPKGDKARGMLLTDTTHTVQLVALKPDGSTAPSTRVQVKLFQINWRWWWEKGSESLAEYASSSSYTPIICDTVNVKNGQGEWSFKIKYPDWGRYLIRAVDLDGNHATGKIVYIDWPGWAGRAQKDVPGGASTLNFSSDKDEYTVGEKVTITIPSAKKGRGLISIENGSRILKQEWVNGESESMRYQFEATPEMTPNIYVSVSYLQPHLTSGNDVPIRTYGIIPVKVSDPATRLQPRIDMPEVFVPEQTSKVNVSEISGKPMTYTVAIVDEGLLDLTRFATPDPWNNFYKREALGITTWDMYDLVAGAYGATLEKLLSIGGDDENQDKGNKQANRFPPMVRFYGPFELQKGKTNEHLIDIPQYIGSVRVMVVAGQNGAFGNAEKTAPVKKPLMILGTLPRVLSIEESADLPVSVFALDSKVKNVQVSIETDGPLSIDGNSEKQLTFSAPGDQVISFNAKAGHSAGVASVTIKASGGGERIAQKIELNVRYPINPVTDVVAGTVPQSGTWKEKVQMPGMKGTNSVALELTTVPPLNLGQRLEYLVQYPHGCVEQTTSSVFPQLYLDKLLDLSQEYRTRIEKNIKSGIDRIKSFQTPDGGFSYWPGNQVSDEWGSCYAGHFLIEAQKAGYTVPNGLLQQWTYYQQNKARSWVSGPYQAELIQAYRLFTLALSGNPDIGAMNRLREQQSLGIAEKWRLAACYQIAGQQQTAQDMVKGLSLSVKPYRELSETYGSDIRDKAMILEALVILNKMEPAAQIAKELSNALSNSSAWYSTQTTAYTLTAMAKYTGIAGSGNSISFSVVWNKGSKENYTSSKPVFQIPLKVANETDAEIEIKNTGNTLLYSRLILNGIPGIGTERSAANGLELSVNYTTTDGKMVSDITKLEQGQDIVAHVTILNKGTRGTYKEVALSHLVPSGWEIHNNRILSEEGSKGFNFQDIRDDRVYTYFNIAQGEEKTFPILLNASYSGKFYLPMISAEAMYDATINARIPGKWITISKP
ncbi:MAG: hypothetical protein GX640_21440, partial [Fibrobacter sp.]|nr:hypothetical protein [Fibrobacter sp.]